MDKSTEKYIVQSLVISSAVTILCPICGGELEDCDICENGYVSIAELFQRLFSIQRSLTAMYHHLLLEKNNCD
jgi:hypothetical protein